MDPPADGQRECASHCEQSYGEFQRTPGCQASSPSNGSKNTATGKENVIFMALPSLCHGALFLPQLQKYMSVCLESGVHEETDSTFLANPPFFVKRSETFLV